MVDKSEASAQNRGAELRLRDVLLRNADLYGNDPAVIFGDVTTDWREFTERSFRLANRLSQSGVERTDRICVLQRNGPEIPEIAFAAALLGAAIVPINPRLTTAEVEYIITDSAVSLAFVEHKHPAIVALRGTEMVITRSEDYERYRDEGAPIEPDEIERAADPIFHLYTSGTTGRPKGVSLTQRAMIQNGLTIQLSQRLRHNDVFLTTTPLTHAAAGTRIFSLATDGMAHVILEKFTPDAFFEAVGRHQVTSTILVPTMLRDLIESPGLQMANLRSLRTIVYGAAPASQDLVTAAIEHLPCDLLQGYGLTEGCPALLMLSPEDHDQARADPNLRHRLSSIGRPVPGVRIRIADDEGGALARGARGELQIRSTKAMNGYWHAPDETALAFRDGWLHTGDVGTVDDDGYVYLVGRKKEMLISGGFNVYPSEIERAIDEHPNVSESCVVGAPHDRWGETPIAFVVKTGPATENEILEHCEVLLADYKRPSRIVFVDHLERNSNGKVIRGALRDLL
ncbi:MAG TPA: AMP-binding protein [Acidimicrobiales bacterium]|jgi:fatty-acyl-CoA synthase/long-chain acyl-CoA synthetase|nr:AMP-binding protein [Acidimicrobiales bacterium]